MSRHYLLFSLLLLPLATRSIPPPLIRPRLSPPVPQSTSTPPSVPSTSLALSPPSPWPNPSHHSEALLLVPPGAPLPSIPTPPTPDPSPSPQPPPNPDANANTTTPSRPLVMAYYPDYVSTDYPPENIDFARFDWIDFAFAIPDQNMAFSWDGSDNAPDTLRRLVTRAHHSGKRVKLSVGGWTGSEFFSTAVSSPQNQLTLANNILSLYHEYNLDGIDIDWEYPGQTGNNGNFVNPDDSTNFLAFLRLLRNTLPPGAIITAAAQTVPFANTDGYPLGNVSDFAKVLDWVLLMNYDAWGSSSKPGPNAPLSDACNNSTQPSANALSALGAWTAAGFPASQLVLGVPSYGYLSRSTENALRTRHFRLRSSSRSWRQRRRHRRTLRQRSPLVDLVSSLVQGSTGLLPSGYVWATNEDAGTDDGQVQFRDLIKQGILQPYASSPSGATNATVEPSDPLPPTGSTGLDGFGGLGGATAMRTAIENREPRNLFTGSGGFERRWDACSSTPYLRSVAAGQIVTFDDPVSLEMKAQLVRVAGMRGVNVFDVHGDTDGWDLTDALRRGLGLL